MAARYDPVTDKLSTFLNGVQIVDFDSPYFACDASFKFMVDMAGQQSEMVVYPSALTDEQVADITADMASRWDVNDAESAGCPVTDTCPFGVTGCTHWYDAQDSSTLRGVAPSYSSVTTAGTQIGTWCSKSSGHKAYGNGTPNLTTSAINGHEAVTFAYGAKSFHAEGDDSYGGSGSFDHSYFVVFRPTSTVSYVGLLAAYRAFGLGAPSTRLTSWINNTSSGNCYVNPSNPAACAATNGVVAINSNWIVGVNFNDATNVREIYRNGDVANNVPYTGATSYSYEMANGIMIGGYFNGYIGEVLMYNKPLTSNEVKAVNCGLADKWDMCVDLYTATSTTYCDGAGFGAEEDSFCVGEDVNP